MLASFFGKKKIFFQLLSFPLSGFPSLHLFSDATTARHRSGLVREIAAEEERQQQQQKRASERAFSLLFAVAVAAASPLLLHLLSLSHLPIPFFHTCRRRCHMYGGLHPSSDAPSFRGGARPLPGVDVARQHEVDRVFEKDRLERACEVARLVDLEGKVGVEGASCWCGWCGWREREGGGGGFGGRARARKTEGEGKEKNLQRPLDLFKGKKVFLTDGARRSATGSWPGPRPPASTAAKPTASTRARRSAPS